MGNRTNVTRATPERETRAMLTRTDGMWWGTAIEAPDPAALASFYAELLGWSIVHQEPGTAIVGAPEGRIYAVFQQATDYERPVWPPEPGRQRPMMHFDFQVADLEVGVAEAVALGATLATHQPQDRVRVLHDPAGHPFCLCLDGE
jgi:catechol 2,3-dioxygenase-like lactoylglutathione lyase family enzyme